MFGVTLCVMLGCDSGVEVSRWVRFNQGVVWEVWCLVWRWEVSQEKPRISRRFVCLITDDACSRGVFIELLRCQGASHPFVLCDPHQWCLDAQSCYHHSWQERVHMPTTVVLLCLPFLLCCAVLRL